MYKESPVSRIQLALNVADLEASVEFYSRLFATEPHKRRPGYANFAIADPPLKLVLIEVPADHRGEGTVGALNHLGIEVDGTGAVASHSARLKDEGMATTDELDTTCCYALQDKVWVHDPAGAPWEVYTVKDDNPEVADGLLVLSSDGACCTTDPAGVSACC
jgi:catechol 2,3-dioxygenase-like lactoylglutathione lyase family enzyme